MKEEIDEIRKQAREKIENIQPGDIVLSYNEITKQNEYSKVLDTMIHRIWTDPLCLRSACYVSDQLSHRDLL